MNKRIMEVKNGNKWIVTTETTNEIEIYKSLTLDLVSKKLNGCTWIKSIKKTSHFDGTMTITVTYDNNSRSIYNVESKL